MKYDRRIRLRGRPWYQVARRVSLGYELDPAENRGFVLLIPAYLVVEDTSSQLRSEVDSSPALGIINARYKCL